MAARWRRRRAAMIRQLEELSIPRSDTALHTTTGRFGRATAQHRRSGFGFFFFFFFFFFFLVFFLFGFFFFLVFFVFLKNILPPGKDDVRAIPNRDSKSPRACYPLNETQIQWSGPKTNNTKHSALALEPGC